MFARADRKVVVGFLLGSERPSLEKVRPARRERPVAGGGDIVARDATAATGSRPSNRVRTPRPSGGCHQCCTSPSTNWRDARAAVARAASSGRGVDQRHRVLQLVAKAVRAAGLVVAGAAPDPARQRLIQQPAVGEEVDGRVRRAHLDGAERPLPVRLHRFERIARGPGVAVMQHQLIGVFLASRPTPSRKTISRDWPSASSNGTWMARARVDPRADAPRQARRAERRDRAAAVAADEFGAIATDRAGDVIDVEKGDVVGKFGVVGVARQDRAAVRDRSR